MFFSKSFVVLALTFRSLIHFELIFVYGVRLGFDFIILHVALQLSRNPLLKTFLSTLDGLSAFLKLS